MATETLILLQNVTTPIKYILGNAEAAKVIRKSNYPDAENFVLNNVLKTPSEADALKMLTNMEQNQATKTTNF